MKPLEVNLLTIPHLKALSSGIESFICHWRGRTFLDTTLIWKVLILLHTEPCERFVLLLFVFGLCYTVNGLHPVGAHSISYITLTKSRNLKVFIHNTGDEFWIIRSFFPIHIDVITIEGEQWEMQLLLILKGSGYSRVSQKVRNLSN